MPIQPPAPDRQQPFAKRLRVCVSRLAPPGWMFFLEELATAECGVDLPTLEGRRSITGDALAHAADACGPRQSFPHLKISKSTIWPAITSYPNILKSFWRSLKIDKFSKPILPDRVEIGKLRRTQSPPLRLFAGLLTGSVGIATLQSLKLMRPTFSAQSPGLRNYSVESLPGYQTSRRSAFRRHADLFSGSAPAKTFSPAHSSPFSTHTQPHNPILMMN
jgi:hypothetical protein